MTVILLCLVIVDLFVGIAGLFQGRKNGQLTQALAARLQLDHQQEEHTMSALSDALAAATADADAANAALDAAITRVQGDLTANATQVAALQAQIATLEAQLAAGEPTKDELDAIAGLRAKLATVLAKAAALDPANPATLPPAPPAS